MWFVYILRCKDKTLYTGVTNNLDGRLKKHNEGKGAKYTRGRVPVKLLYKERFRSKGSALSREAAIKKMSRPMKLSLIKKSSSK